MGILSHFMVFLSKTLLYNYLKEKQQEQTSPSFLLYHTPSTHKTTSQSKPSSAHWSTRVT